MTKSHTTEAKKRLWLPRLIDELGGFICYQCEDTLKPGHYVFEHLDDNREHSVYENTSLSCVSCNNKKQHDFDMQLKAMDLLHKKEEACLKYLDDENAHQNNSSEININQLLWAFTEQRISERVKADNQYLFEDAIAEIPYNCQELYGHGSEQTIRRMIKQQTCNDAPFRVVKNKKGKKIICRRSLK